MTNIPNQQLKDDFSLYIKYLPNRDYGPNLHPMQAILTLNDMRTLRSKMDLMSRSTMKVAKFLQKHPKVESVAYLGLPDHPLHALATKYMWLVDAEHDEMYGKPVNRYGHLMSFCVKGGAEAARGFRWPAADLAGHRSGTDQKRGHDSGDLHTPATRRGRTQAGPYPAPPDPALHRGRTPRRHHGRPDQALHKA